MALGGGKIPFDPAKALAGPARVLYAPISAAVPDDLWDVVPAVADVNGEYPAVSPWVDFGLAADAPTYSHSRETQGLEYEQSAGVLFETLSEVARSFTAQIGGISDVNMKVVENTSAAIATVAAAAGKSAQKRVSFGNYTSLTPYRIAMIAFRPDGSTVVTEPAPSNAVRPAAVGLLFPRVVLGAEDSEFEFGAGSPVNAPITFIVQDEPTISTADKQGYWLFEQEGTIT